MNDKQRQGFQVCAKNKILNVLTKFYLTICKKKEVW